MDFSELVNNFNEKFNTLKEKNNSLKLSLNENHYIVKMGDTFVSAFLQYQEVSNLIDDIDKERYYLLLIYTLNLALDVLDVKSVDSYEKMSIFKKRKRIKEDNIEKEEKIKNTLIKIEEINSLIDKYIK